MLLLFTIQGNTRSIKNWRNKFKTHEMHKQMFSADILCNKKKEIFQNFWQKVTVLLVKNAAHSELDE